jgi:hypothetical protein
MKTLTYTGALPSGTVKLDAETEINFVFGEPFQIDDRYAAKLNNPDFVEHQPDAPKKDK